jgi:hypothetical protein
MPGIVEKSVIDL